MEKSARVIEIFYSYAHEDEQLRERLLKHLSGLQKQGLITNWHDRNIQAGKEWAKEISVHLDTADIILLLVSPDFLASDYINSVEMKRALERHSAKEAWVIPVILVSVYWEYAPFSKLQALPRDGKPVMSRHWHDWDEAFAGVAKGISDVIKKLPPKTKEQWLKDGSVYQRAELYKEALHAAEEAIQLDSQYATAHKRKGDALFSLGDYEGALKAYEQAIQLDSDYPSPYLGRGEVLRIYHKRYEESLVAYEQAIRLDPNYADAYHGKARALQHLGRLVESQIAEEKARQLGYTG